MAWIVAEDGQTIFEMTPDEAEALANELRARVKAAQPGEQINLHDVFSSLFPHPA